jgi:AcrR family transcriptional regulator
MMHARLSNLRTSRPSDIDGQRAEPDRKSQTDHAEPGRRRVAPLSPDDRRAALIEATVPLLLESGSAVSSRQIAQAAGVAEGTIFRVFPDKNSLILAAIRHALDPEPGVVAMRELAKSSSDIRTRVTRAVEMMLTGLRRFGRLHMIARELVIEFGATSDFGAEMRGNQLRLQDALATVFEADAARLRVTPTTAGRLLMLTVVGMSGFAFGQVEEIEPTQIVSVLLDGLLVPDVTDATDATDAAGSAAPDSPRTGSSRPGPAKESPC